MMMLLLSSARARNLVAMETQLDTTGLDKGQTMSALDCKTHDKLSMYYWTFNTIDHFIKELLEPSFTSQ